MDELMARFYTNLTRQEFKDEFKNQKKKLMQPDLKKIDREDIEGHVEASMQALKNLLSSITIDMERQPNTEN